ncbi:Hypothetical protein PBC10988_17900 [Planctomycetales bacterium 10988]|nr:Hypothetical protein PBC10988_17900 [Planctomycetales bacterium 10988]
MNHLQRVFSFAAALCVSFLMANNPAWAERPTVSMPLSQKLFFENHCVHCHNEDYPGGEVRLDNIAFSIDTIAKAELWQKVLNALNSGEMPPEGEAEPSDQEKTEFLDYLSNTMVTARAKLSDQGGVITMRRLNRREYANTIKELLGVEVDVTGLPSDEGSGTFDTVGSSLFFSSDQFEQYLEVAQVALDRATVEGEKPKFYKVHTEAEIQANRWVKKQLRERLLKDYKAARSWMAQKELPPKAFGLLDENDVKFRLRRWEEEGPMHGQYLALPHSDTGAYLTIYSPYKEHKVSIYPKIPNGKYRIRLQVARVEDAPLDQSFVEAGYSSNGGKTFNIIESFQVTGTFKKPQIVELTVEVTSKDDRTISFRQKQQNNKSAFFEYYRDEVRRNGVGPDPYIWIDWTEWEGPVLEQWPPMTHQNLFFRGKKAKFTDDYAKDIIARFAERAFRGQEPTEAYLDRLFSLYQSQKKLGADFHEAVKLPLSVILASPSFLYLVEPIEEFADYDQQPETVAGVNSEGQKNPTRELSSIELANRLSYFLWSSPPDAELLDLAKTGQLNDPVILSEQVDRMLFDPKSKEFIEGFFKQWLHMERLEFFQFNPDLYWKFDDTMKNAAREEVFQTVDLLIKDDLSVGNLLKADFVVINNLLADFYGLEQAKENTFRKVQVPPDSPRGGLLGMAAILAMGSDGERTSPVERGAFVLRKMLHDPPPPAPPNVPQLNRLAGQLHSSRTLLSAHQEEAQCAQCHRKIDPIGFGLENFNAVGQWRETETAELRRGRRVVRKKEFDIDPSGTLPNGTKFDDYFEMREAIAQETDAFTRGLVEALLEYSLGRPFGFSDEELAEQLVADAQSNEYGFRSLIHSIVRTEAFQLKK